MKKVWSLGTLGVFIVSLGAFVAAQQTATKPAQAKPAAKAAAKADKEDDEKDEQAGTKKYTMAAELPAAVKDAFKKSYPKATIRGTAKETEDGKTVYEVESVENAKARDLMYNVDGSVISIEEEMNAADLPAPVAAALKKLYPKATITVAEKVTEGKTVQYELQIKGAAVASVAFLPDGKPVPPEAPEKEKK
jgi:hypothetical protein